MTEPIELRLSVPCSPEHAFEVWTRRTSMWWPSSHSVSGDPGLSVTIDPRVGGRIVERATDGEEHTWGEILDWRPPTSFRYRWHLNQQGADATEVTIEFLEAVDGAEVRITHRGWERLGARGPGLQQRNREGWAGVLPQYERACSA
jgi:Activator of Hsp90 ATPase homolog 1-like protein